MATLASILTIAATTFGLHDVAPVSHDGDMPGSKPAPTPRQPLEAREREGAPRRDMVNWRRHLIRRYEPYTGCTTYDGCTRYPIPAGVVECESHGEVHEQSHPYSSSGEFQIELTSWQEFGGLRFASFPYLASKLQQSIVARRILAAQGPDAWSCTALVGWS